MYMHIHIYSGLFVLALMDHLCHCKLLITEKNEKKQTYLSFNCYYQMFHYRILQRQTKIMNKQNTFINYKHLLIVYYAYRS